MIINIDYLENKLVIDSDKVLNVEIENRKYFYRIVNDLYEISEGNNLDYINFYNDGKEESISGKMSIITNYFNFDFKKYSTGINKYIAENIEDKEKHELIKLFNQLLKKYKNSVGKLDLPISVQDETSIEKIIKSMKVDMNKTDELLNNLLNIIEIEKEIPINKLLVFINLKQYLNREELKELYKYSLYNNVKILLIDSQSYGVNQEYEKKLVIDESLVEFML